MNKGKGRGRPQTKADRLGSAHASKPVDKATNAIETSPAAPTPGKPPKTASAPIRKEEMPQPPPSPRVEKKASHPRWFWAAMVQFPLLILSVVSNIVTLRGPVWPTAPIFSPSYPSAASPFDVPFNVENKSSIFPIKNVHITCIIKNVETKSTHAQISNVAIMHEIANQIIEPSSTRIYTCPLSSTIALPEDFISNAAIEFKYEYEHEYMLFSKSYKETTGVFFLNTKVSPPRWEF